MNRVGRLLQFNKSNGEFITTLEQVPSDWLNHELYHYTDVINIDEENEVVVGTWDNFEIVAKSEQPFEISEDALNQLARERITREYPIESQLNIIGGVLERVAEANGVDCEELKAMNDMVSEIRRTNALRKEFFASNPEYTYVSSSDAKSVLEKKYAGVIDAERQILDN